MTEFGIYSGNGGYSSSYSNLSALAPPFTVDRSKPRPPAAPVLGLTEPSFNCTFNSTLNNWLDPSSKDFFSQLDSIPPPNVYPFHANDYSYSRQTVHMPTLDSIATASTAAFSYDSNMDSARNDFAEATVYYPSNVSPTVRISAPHVASLNEPSRDQTSSSYHTAQWDGFWEGSTWDQVLRGSFSQEMNAAAPSILDGHRGSGGHMPKGQAIPDKSSLGIDMLAKEAQVGAAGTGKEDPKYLLGQHRSDISVRKRTVTGPSSVHSGNSMQAPLAKAVKSKGTQMTLSGPYEKGVKHIALSNNLSAASSSPVLLSEPPVAGATCSMSDTVSFGAVDPGVSAADTGFSVNNRSNVKEPSQMTSHGRKVCFNPHLVSIQLQKNDPVSSEFSSIGNGELSNNGIACDDVLDHLFGAKSGIQASQFNPGDLNPALDGNEASMEVEKSLDILDHYTPSVDSPCWKGSSGSQFSPFRTTEVVFRNIKDLEACGTNIQGPQVALTPDNIANALNISSEDPGKVLGSSENEIPGNSSVISLRPAVSNVQLGDALSDGAREKMSWTAKRTCVNDCLNDVNEPREGCSLSEKSVDESNKSVTKSDIRFCQTVQPSFQGTMAASDRLLHSETCVADSSDTNMSFLPTGEFINLPFSLGAPTMHCQSYHRKPSPKNHARALVNTMNNLSELLLFYCSEEDFELKEKDIKALKNVTDNLDKCMSKNFGLESLLPELQEVVSVDRQKTEVPNILSWPQFSEVRGKLNYSANRDKECSNSPCVKVDAGMKMKEEKIIQAIKKVLCDNFHKKEENPQITMYKNLWLEAEAALCASNCTARYNRMKIEMEKFKSESSRDLLEGTVGEKKLSSAEADAGLQPGAEDGPSSACISIQNSTVRRTSANSDDVRARFPILKSRGDNTNYRKAGNVDELPSFKVSPDCDIIDTSALTETKDFPTSDPSIQGSPILSATSQVNDVEASVMAMFQILRNRAEGSSSRVNEGKPLPQFSNLEFVGEKREDSFGKDIIENVGEMVPLLQPIVANHAGMGLKAFDVNSDPVIQRPTASRLGNHLSSGWNDSSSSDWEHVFKEEL